MAPHQLSTSLLVYMCTCVCVYVFVCALVVSEVSSGFSVSVALYFVQTGLSLNQQFGRSPGKHQGSSLWYIRLRK